MVEKFFFLFWLNWPLLQPFVHVGGFYVKIKAGAGGIAEIGTIKQENSNCLTAWNQNFKTARNYVFFMVLSEVFTRIKT